MTVESEEASVASKAGEDKTPKSSKKGVSFIKEKKKRHKSSEKEDSSSVAGATAPPVDNAAVEELTTNMEQVKKTMLLISQRMVALQEWRAQVWKDIPRMKRKVDVLYKEREKIEKELVDSILRSSVDERDQRKMLQQSPSIKQKAQETFPNLAALADNDRYVNVTTHSGEDYAGSVSPSTSTLPALSNRFENKPLAVRLN